MRLIGRRLASASLREAGGAEAIQLNYLNGLPQSLALLRNDGFGFPIMVMNND